MKKSLIFFSVTLLFCLFMQTMDMKASVVVSGITKDTSISNLEWKVIRSNEQVPGSFTSFTLPFNKYQGNITGFRGGNFRNNPSLGAIKGKPVGLKQEWVFTTRNSSVAEGNDGSKYSKINWGGGSGWTGQPSLVMWSRGMKDSLGITDPAFLQNDQAREVIIGSLTGEIYFFDFATGKQTRKPMSIDGPIKGSITIDPRLNGMLFVGQGIPKGKRFGAYLIDMTKRKVALHLPGIDPDAPRGWGAFDSSPLLERSSGTLFWPSENGLIYRVNVEDKNKPYVEAKLRYRRVGMGRLGLEASMAAIGSLGYFADNSGNILCVDLVSMKPIWKFDNEDDTDASIAVDQEGREHYLYVGNEVDHRQPHAKASLRKLNARNGQLIWSVSRECSGNLLDGKENSGGLLSTPLIGKQRGSHVVISIFSRPNRGRKAELVAVDKRNGKELYNFQLDAYTWASPADFYDEAGNMYLFFSDVIGNLYLMDALSGKLLSKTASGNSMESSPIIFNNRIVVGTRGNRILCYNILTN